jgi:hypothetical protein
MTLAEIRTSVRNFAKATSTAAGTLFPADNVLLDYFINSACDFVVLDLVKELPNRFLAYEDITLVANIQTYTLTKEWLQVWAMNLNITGRSPIPITYVPWTDEVLAQYSGQTSAEPPIFTISGNSFYFLPKPAAAKANYARVWVVEAELATIGTDGPTKIPRIAQRLIPLQAMIQIGTMLEANIQNWAGLYAMLLKKVSVVLGNPIQGQPRFIGGSFRDKAIYDSRDPTGYDPIGFFER